MTCYSSHACLNIEPQKVFEAQMKMNALIVEDDLVTQMCHRCLMKRYNFESKVVANGKAAVDLYLSGTTHFDVVLMDMEMPIMNGLETIEKLRASGFKSLIVGVTSRDLEFATRVFKAAGADLCYEKPLMSTNVTSILEKMSNN